MFKEAFKYYKSKNPPPDLSNLIQIDKNEVQVSIKTLIKIYAF